MGRDAASRAGKGNARTGQGRARVGDVWKVLAGEGQGGVGSVRDGAAQFESVLQGIELWRRR